MLARQALQAYFVQAGTPNVSMLRSSSVQPLVQPVRDGTVKPRYQTSA